MGIYRLFLTQIGRLGKKIWPYKVSYNMNYTLTKKRVNSCTLIDDRLVVGETVSNLTNSSSFCFSSHLSQSGGGAAWPCHGYGSHCSPNHGRPPVDVPPNK